MGNSTRILSCVCVVFCAAQTLRAAVLTPSEVLLVTFTTTPGAMPVPDTFTLNLGTVQVLAAHTSRTGALYDGPTLLGTGSTSSFGTHVGALSLNPARSWKSPTSLWDFDNPAIADFTTIANGMINGRIEFTIQTGAMDINLANVFIRMGQAFQSNGFTQSNPQPVLTSVQIVPEPASLCAAVLGAAVLARRRHR